MESFAELVARHAMLVLLVAAGLALVATVLFWRFINAYAPACWDLVVKLWRVLAASRIAARLRRLPVLGFVLTRTLTAARYLGVFALAAFGVAACALALFFELVDELGVGESLANFDASLSAALRKHLPYDTLRFFSAITKLGDPEFLIALVITVATTLVALRRWTLAGAWIVATASGGLLNRLLKALFERTRPLHDHGLASELGWSFPSGHASGSVLVYGLLGYLIVRHAPTGWRIPVALLSVALIIFVGSSRVLLQVHHLSDVLAGYASGAVWVAICIAGLEAVRWREIRSQSASI
jgi:undecaprenyl-diphosphatase